MPQNIIMNGMTSHAFAALMTATVVMFPTPEDLWKTVMNRPLSAEDASLVSGGVERLFPVALSAATPTQQLTTALGYCADDLSGTLPVHTEECIGIMGLAAQRIAAAPTDPDLALTEQKLRLARSLYCRQQWAGAMSSESTFDVIQCQTESPGLADEA